MRYNTSYRQTLKQKILATAMMLFSERGIKAVKMDDISNHLSISKRTLYEIYDNKEDLLFECLKNRFEESEKQLADSVANADNVMDILISIYRIKVDILTFALFDVSNRYVLSNYSSFRFTMEQVFYNLIFVFLRGFCTMKGIEVLDKFLEEDAEMRKLRDGLATASEITEN